MAPTGMTAGSLPEPAQTLRRGSLVVERFPVGIHRANAYIVYGEPNRAGVLIDPGSEEAVLNTRVAGLRLSIKGILLTHAHWDHVGALSAVAKCCNAPIFLHAADRAILKAAPFYAFRVDGVQFTVPAETVALETPSLEFEGVPPISHCHVPGHTPGGVTYRIGEVVFTGDTLLPSGPGRTDLPGGNGVALRESLQILRSELHEDDAVCPGHGRVCCGVDAREWLIRWSMAS